MPALVNTVTDESGYPTLKFPTVDSPLQYVPMTHTNLTIFSHSGILMGLLLLLNLAYLKITQFTY